MLDNHHLTNHAVTRMQQRGIRNSDLELLLLTASQVSPDAYLLTNKDAEREIAARKREIQSLERLKGKKVVVKEATILTCYPSRATDQKSTLRYGRSYQ